jgi:hypothetical protein
MLTGTLSTFWIGAIVLHAVSATAAASTASLLEIRIMDLPCRCSRNHPRTRPLHDTSAAPKRDKVLVVVPAESAQGRECVTMAIDPCESC